MSIVGGWAAVVIGGCAIQVDPGALNGGSTGGTSGGDVIDGNRGGGFPSGPGKTSGEPNDKFSQAVVALLDSNNIARLEGMVSRVGDLDVFSLGSLQEGERFIADFSTTGSSLDGSIAVFDSLGRLVFANDDRGGSADRFLDPYVDFVVHRASDPYFLVVTHASFADPGTFTGSYQIDVQIVRGGTPPRPVGQVLLLDFDGAVVDIPSIVMPLGLSRLVVDPFSAGAISSIYAGKTALIKEGIRTGFEQNFARFDVTIMTTDDPPPPPGAKFSTVIFGGFNRDLFGIAENVDLYNVDFCDDAVIFTESFEPIAFSFTPTAEELALAISNVGSHEAGHLLGLNHVDDDRALMDDRSPADAFIADQEFMEGALSSDIMSIGTQDAPLLLTETLGPPPGGAFRVRSIPALRRRDSAAPWGGRIWRRITSKNGTKGR